MHSLADYYGFNGVGTMRRIVIEERRPNANILSLLRSPAFMSSFIKMLSQDHKYKVHWMQFKYLSREMSNHVHVYTERVQILSK
jgi:hypothetical protein